MKSTSSNKLVLGQLIYGVGSSGYGVLGVSPSAIRFSSFFASMCQSLGTQPRSVAFGRILLSRRSGTNVVIVCCVPGSPDSAGRPTLFFHGLTGSADELQRAGIDAFSLAERNLFVRSFAPASGLEDLEVPSEPTNVPQTPFLVRFPAAIRMDGPDEALFRGLLGRDSLDRPWKTFSFSPDERDDLIAVPEGAPVPDWYSVYDRDGRCLRPPCSSRPVESTTVLGTVTSKGPDSFRPVSGRFSLALSGSLVLNLILLGWVVFRNSPVDKGSEAPDSKRPPGQIFSSETSPKATDIPSSGITIPENQFPAFARIADFENELTNTCEFLRSAWNDPYTDAHRDARSFLTRCKPYVQWVDTHFPVQSESQSPKEN